jgi:hypothetical protein
MTISQVLLPPRDARDYADVLSAPVRSNQQT